MWRPVMNAARALIALPIQQQIAHTTTTFYTIQQTTVHYTSGGTKTKHTTTHTKTYAGLIEAIH